MLMLMPLAAIAALLAAAVGMWMSALNVKYRDVRYALPFLIQVWMFATPIIYPASIVPAKWRWLLDFNPLTGMIEGFRSALFGRAFHWAISVRQPRSRWRHWCTRPTRSAGWNANSPTSSDMRSFNLLLGKVRWA